MYFNYSFEDEKDLQYKGSWGLKKYIIIRAESKKVPIRPNLRRPNSYIKQMREQIGSNSEFVDLIKPTLLTIKIIDGGYKKCEADHMENS